MTLCVQMEKNMQGNAFGESNQSIFRVWLPDKKKKWLLPDQKQKRKVGHISMEIFTENETESTYVSFWPKDKSEDGSILSKVKSLASKEDGEFTPDIETDITFETPIDKNGYSSINDFPGPSIPDVVICLYSLDVSKMLEHVKELKNTKTWTISGPFFYGSSHSCASAVLELLKVGGFSNLISRGLDQSSNNISANPWNMASLLIKAKQKELKIYPDTKNYEPNLRSTDITFDIPIKQEEEIREQEKSYFYEDEETNLEANLNSTSCCKLSCCHLAAAFVSLLAAYYIFFYRATSEENYEYLL